MENHKFKRPAKIVVSGISAGFLAAIIGFGVQQKPFAPSSFDLGKMVKANAIANQRDEFKLSEENSTNNVLSSIDYFAERDGKIEDDMLPIYVISEHNDWDLTMERSVVGYQVFTQNQFSYYEAYYYADVNGSSYIQGPVSEGNCGLVATYSLLYNLPTIKDYLGSPLEIADGLLDSRKTINVISHFANRTDPLYSRYGNVTYYQSSDSNNKIFFTQLLREERYYKVFWECDPYNNDLMQSTPELYWEIRKSALDIGYTASGGFNSSYLEWLIEDTANLYEVDLDILNSASEEAVAANIVRGLPSIIVTENSLTYKGHAMNIVGFSRYFEESTNEYRYMWLVSDGHDWTPTWFDPYKATRVLYFAVDHESLEWPSC